MLVKVVVALGVAVGCNPPLAGQNLISNGDFNVGVNSEGWIVHYASSTGNGSFDADLCIGSGTLFATRGGLSSVEMHADGDCIPVAQGETLYPAVLYNTPATNFRIWLDQFWDASCSQLRVSSTYPDGFGPTSGWATAAQPFPIGPDTGAVKLFFTADASSPFTVEIDRVYIGRSPRIFADDLEGVSSCRWSDVVP
ncbi:MAG: hypothetical protein ABIV06_07315 [Thermoanaerobaculia bacterium]